MFLLNACSSNSCDMFETILRLSVSSGRTFSSSTLEGTKAFVSRFCESILGVEILSCDFITISVKLSAIVTADVTFFDTLLLGASFSSDFSPSVLIGCEKGA